MPYIGRDLTQGNYIKLDDLSSQFNGTTSTFTLRSGGASFRPGSANGLLVSLGGVIQEPIEAFTVTNDQITFTNAPTAGTDVFIVALGAAVSIGVPADGSVTGSKLSTPFNYVGVLSATSFTGDGSQLTGISVDWKRDNIGLTTTSPVGFGTTSVADKDLTGVGNSFQGIYVSNGLVVFDNTLNGSHYIGTNFNGLMAGPVTIGGTITIDGNYVVV